MDWSEAQIVEVYKCLSPERRPGLPVSASAPEHDFIRDPSDRQPRVIDLASIGK